MEIDNSQFVYPQILEKDRNLVCRIVERLWTTKLENSGTRLIICMEGINIQERSVELLKQIYLLLPQRLRLDMGFATCSTFNDIKTLTEKCDLPISVFTMATDDIEKARQIVDETEFRYPIILFDAESPENEPCDIKKLELLTSLSRKISPSTDAKIGYAEKIVLKEKRGMVSFKNMESTLEKINGEPFCWWERKDLEKIEEVYNLYEDQKEMMEVEILRRESLNTFYTKLLPWKDYAKQIAQVVEDDNYPNRQEILKFFSEELKFAKVIEAMEEMRESLEKKSIEHEQKAVARGRSFLESRCGTAAEAASGSTGGKR